MGKAISRYDGKIAVPVEAAFPPVFNMARSFDDRLGDPLPLRVYESPIQ
jgi:hypothetical protein